MRASVCLHRCACFARKCVESAAHAWERGGCRAHARAHQGSGGGRRLGSQLGSQLTGKSYCSLEKVEAARACCGGAGAVVAASSMARMSRPASCCRALGLGILFKSIVLITRAH